MEIDEILKDQSFSKLQRPWVVKKTGGSVLGELVSGMALEIGLA
jgi:hypothetical protein